MSQELHNHLLSRGCDPSRYHVVLDEENQTATFILFTLSGKLAGYQQYKPFAPKKKTKDLKPSDLKYFTWVTKNDNVSQDVVVFGTECFDWRKKEVYLVEGIFDAVKLHSLGLNCLAVLCCDPKPLRPFFKSLGMRVIGVLDNDPAGMLLRNTCDSYVVCDQGKDPGDMSLEEISNLLENLK